MQISAAAGGGVLLGFSLLETTGTTVWAATQASELFAPNAFIRIGRDDSVTLIMPYVEMGQGTYTSMPMLIAEELEVSLDKVTLEAAPPDDRQYANSILGFQVTGGSTSIRAAWLPLRHAGAVARVLLISAAAQMWGVDPMSCRAEAGQVIHVPTGRALKIWRRGRHRRDIADALRCAAQRSEGLQAYRHAGQAPRHPRQSERQGAFQHRRSNPWNEIRLGIRLSRLRRHARTRR